MKIVKIGTSYTPARDAEFKALQDEVLARQARIETLIAKVKEMAKS